MLENHKTVQTEKLSVSENFVGYNAPKFENNSPASHFIAGQIFYGLISSLEDLENFKTKLPHLKDVAATCCDDLFARNLVTIEDGQFIVNRIHWSIPQTKESLLNSCPEMAKALAKRAILDRTEDPSDKLSLFRMMSFSDNKEIENRIQLATDRFYKELSEISRDDDKLEAKNKSWNIIINSGSFKEEDF